MHSLSRTQNNHRCEQVLAARDHVPHAYYKYFFESLLGTVRDGIAECSEVRGVVLFGVMFILPLFRGLLSRCVFPLVRGIPLLCVECDDHFSRRVTV